MKKDGNKKKSIRLSEHLDIAQEIYDTYNDLPCYEAIGFVSDKARELGVSRHTIYQIIHANGFYEILENKSAERGE